MRAQPEVRPIHWKTTRRRRSGKPRSTLWRPCSSGPVTTLSDGFLAIPIYVSLTSLLVEPEELLGASITDG